MAAGERARAGGADDSGAIVTRLLTDDQPLKLPHFKYTGDSVVVTSIDVDMDAEVLVVAGNCYEWVIINHGKIEHHSDCGYGQASIALRDGLIAFHGLPMVQS
jgi:hypothetical protein